MYLVIGRLSETSTEYSPGLCISDYEQPTLPQDITRLIFITKVQSKVRRFWPKTRMKSIWYWSSKYLKSKKLIPYLQHILLMFQLNKNKKFPVTISHPTSKGKWNWSWKTLILSSGGARLNLSVCNTFCFGTTYLNRLRCNLRTWGSRHTISCFWASVSITGLEENFLRFAEVKHTVTQYKSW